MAILKQLSNDQIKAKFTHYGLLFGFVPVYVGDPEGECLVAVRNGWPDWLIGFGEVLMTAFFTVQCWLDPEFEPAFPLRLRGRIK